MGKKQNPDFIGSYKNALFKDECKAIIQYFEDSKEKSPGEKRCQIGENFTPCTTGDIAGTVE
ncbi:hypothetical protein EBT25_15335 [bacterium]|nr:hypothetical protein [bacterium]